MGCAGGGGMHPLSFQLKRAYLSLVEKGKRVVKEVPDMTRARFDLLYFVHRQRRGWRGVGLPPRREMGAIREALGVSAATVSKMIKRLVGLGLVTTARG